MHGHDALKYRHSVAAHKKLAVSHISDPQFSAVKPHQYLLIIAAKTVKRRRRHRRTSSCAARQRFSASPLPHPHAQVMRVRYVYHLGVYTLRKKRTVLK